MADDSDQLLALATRLDKAASEICRQVTEVHDVADELAAMAENGGEVEPPDPPEPPAEGAYPADPAQLDGDQPRRRRAAQPGAAGRAARAWAWSWRRSPASTRPSWNSVPLDGFAADRSRRQLAGNTLRLYHRALAANERLNMLALTSLAGRERARLGRLVPGRRRRVRRLPRSAPLRPTPAEIEIKLEEPPGRGAGRSRRSPTTGARPTSGPATTRPRSRTRRAPTRADTARRSRSASAPLRATARCAGRARPRLAG